MLIIDDTGETTLGRDRSRGPDSPRHRKCPTTHELGTETDFQLLDLKLESQSVSNNERPYSLKVVNFKFLPKPFIYV